MDRYTIRDQINHSPLPVRATVILRGHPFPKVLPNCEILDMALDGEWICLDSPDLKPSSQVFMAEDLLNMRLRPRAVST